MKNNKKNKKGILKCNCLIKTPIKTIISCHYFQNQCTCGLQSDPAEVLNCRHCEQTANVVWNNNLTSQLVPHNILYNRRSAL